MRVVAGEYRSRLLKTPQGRNTRPTTDKVKGAIFNMIGPYFDGGVVLDLYAGSGSLGIEALSRGMNKGYFVDNNFKSIQIIKENISSLKIDNQCDVIKQDANQALNNLILHNKKFDLILLDPPYAKQDIEHQLSKIIKNNLLETKGKIVCEVDKEVSLQTPEGLKLIKENEYGITKILVYEIEG